MEIDEIMNYIKMCIRDSHQILGADRQGHPAGTLYGTAEHPGEAVEDHGRRLAQPG